jgi:hypothetical protein
MMAHQSDVKNKFICNCDIKLQAEIFFTHLITLQLSALSIRIFNFVSGLGLIVKVWEDWEETCQLEIYTEET